MLSAEDLTYIRNELKRDPSEVERACFENLWSEHCSYRSTSQLLHTLPTDGENVIIGPGDDAAIVKFSDDYAIVIGMESHNHPSYVDPYHGAATGVGGIVRDVVSMGGRPIALMDPLYFGPLSNEKNRYLFEHVVCGIGDYGNSIGVPIVRGEVVFDPGYSGNPLVNVVCIGIVHPEHFWIGHAQRAKDFLVLVGSSTGRDGFGGASFASRDLSEDATAEDRPSVQIGDPFTEKLIIDAMLEMAATGKVHACKDLGAAGLAGASSEMCSTFGGLIYADRVHLREKEMSPVEIMLSESQERMLLAVTSEDVQAIGRIAEKFDLRWSKIGKIIEQRSYIVKFNGNIVCNLPINLLVGGAPTCQWSRMESHQGTSFKKPREPTKKLVLKVLSHPDIANKEWVYQQYDHDVQLRTISISNDAAIIRLGLHALALSCGCNPRHIFLTPYEGTANAVIENASNLVTKGATPLCIVNCLNFASPVHPQIMWQLEQCIHGLGDMARKIKVPVVGGNVSLYNESDELGTQIKPTPSIGMVGRARIFSILSPSDGDELVLIGNTGPHFGGSVLDAVTNCGGLPPPIGNPEILESIRLLVETRLISGVVDISHGGLVAALAEMAPRCKVTLDGDLVTELFSETYGRFLVAIQNESNLRGLPYRIIGELNGNAMVIRGEQEKLKISIDEIKRASNTINAMMRF